MLGCRGRAAESASAPSRTDCNASSCSYAGADQSTSMSQDLAPAASCRRFVRLDAAFELRTAIQSVSFLRMLLIQQPVPCSSVPCFRHLCLLKQGLDLLLCHLGQQSLAGLDYGVNQAALLFLKCEYLFLNGSFSDELHHID